MNCIGKLDDHVQNTMYLCCDYFMDIYKKGPFNFLIIIVIPMTEFILVNFYTLWSMRVRLYYLIISCQTVHVLTTN
jgi:ABC-type methionine transport system permease subunit